MIHANILVQLFDFGILSLDDEKLLLIFADFAFPCVNRNETGNDVDYRGEKMRRGQSSQMQTTCSKRTSISNTQQIHVPHAARPSLTMPELSRSAVSGLGTVT